MGTLGKDSALEQAADYLRQNRQLRLAIGAGDDVSLEPHYLGEGEHNLNFHFHNPADGNAYVLRVNVSPQPFHRNQVAYEFAALKALEASGCTPQPIFLDDTTEALGKGVLLESFCEGEQLDFDRLLPGDLECAVQLMADVHAVPIAPDCPLHRPRDPLADLFDECRKRYELYRSSAFENKRITNWAERFMREASRYLEQTPPLPDDDRHIVNTETLASHFLIPEGSKREVAERSREASTCSPEVAERSREASTCSPEVAATSGSMRFCGHPGAFIDWERPIIGDIAQDVAYFVSPTTTFWDSDYLMPANVAERVVDDYWRAIDGRFTCNDFEERFHSYRVMTVLRSVTWCCRALVQYAQDGTHKTEKTERKLPVYLSDDFMYFLAEECLG